MRICYVGNHDQPHGNDDEGAITHALIKLGHRVERVREVMGHRANRIRNADFALFHKWSNFKLIEHLEMPAVFWHFDLVDWQGDPTIATRCKARVDWMRRVIPLCLMGFCTDGDWVDRFNGEALQSTPSDLVDAFKPPLVWLPQGADQRIAGKGVGTEFPHERTPILFVGTKRGGEIRESFVEEMATRYSGKFVHVEKDCHGEELKRMIACSEIVVAPDSPVTPLYCSNRAYVMLGFGAFLLHPRCDSLAKIYADGEHLVFYDGRDDLHAKIKLYLAKPSLRRKIAEAGLKHTLEHHTYGHRCERLIEIIRERLGK